MKKTNPQTGKKKGKARWRSTHKWIGLVFSVFIIVFCFSGIILNHRRLFSSCEVSRWWMPSNYHIKDWNQSVIKGTLPTDSNRIIAYGQAGIWLTDRDFGNWHDLNKGLDKGIDNRKITNIVRTGDGTLWCSALYDVYRYDKTKKCWGKVTLPGNNERVSDIALRGNDTIVVATRSEIYEAVAPSYNFALRRLKTPEGHSSKVTLFKTFWMLHSGDMFGLAGRLFVDFIAVAIIFLCISGIVFFVLTNSVKHLSKQAKNDSAEKAERLKKTIKTYAGWMRWNVKWHNKLGVWLIVFTLILSVTGMCLRPPLMIPLVMTEVSPILGSTLSSKNAFCDKMRGIRWDANLQKWILGTSEGFYTADKDFSSAPEKMQGAPKVSPMGINVFCKNPDNDGEWLIGSFNGLTRWNPATAEQTDWFTGKTPVVPKGIPIASHAVTGFTADLKGKSPVVFEYSAAPNVKMPEMPDVLKNQPMSLWNFALEMHVGRCYEPFLGSVLSVLFVFISGLQLTLVLVSGYIIRIKTKKKLLNY